MEFSYENIRLGDLDIEFNYINFEIACNGDSKTIRLGMIEDEEEREYGRDQSRKIKLISKNTKVQS